MLSTKNFHFDSKNKTLTAECSELIYQTASNFLGVQSERTGKVVYFKLEKSYFDPDGDWTHSIYKPEVECGVKELVILND